MYPVLLEHLRKSMTDQLISGMITSNLGNGIAIGTPCLIDIGSVAQQGLSISQAAEKVREKLEARDIDAVNEMMSTTGWNLPITVVFPPRRRYGYRLNAHGHQVHCFLTPPIIYDSGKIVEAVSLKSVMNSKIIKTVPEKMLDNLKADRYVTYIIKDMCKSKYKDFKATLSSLTNYLREKYRHNVCVDYQGSVSYVLVDTIIISFFRLSDVIPIFDSGHIRGFAMNIILTNSTLTQLDMGRDGYHSSIMWLFSENEDNILTIDGENIKRQNQVGTMDALAPLVYDPLRRHLPNDGALKKRVSKSKNGGK